MLSSLWSLAAAASFSLMAAIVKLSSGEFGSLELVFYRSVFGMVLMMFLAASQHGSMRTEHFRDHMIRSGLGVLSVALWFFTLRDMTFSTNMTLIYTTPLFMAANFIVLAKMKHERAPWAMVASILVGFIGITLILRPEFHEKDFIPGLVCLFISAIDLLVYWQMEKMGKLGEPSWRIVFYFSLLGAIFSFIGQWVFSDGFHFPSPHGAFCILGIGVFATLGQIFMTRAYAYGNLLLSSCLGFSAIPFSAIFGYFIFDDPITVMSLIAMSLVLASGVAASVTTKRMEETLVHGKRG